MPHTLLLPHVLIIRVYRLAANTYQSLDSVYTVAVSPPGRTIPAFFFLEPCLHSHVHCVKLLKSWGRICFLSFFEQSLM